MVRKSRDEKNQLEKYQTFKEAFKTYDYYIQNENYIAAFVIAFSILEDRLSACFYLDYQLNNQTYTGNNPFPGISDRLKKIKNNLESSEYDEILKIAKFRNSKIHASMWNIGEIKLPDCEKVIKVVRTLDKISKRYNADIKKLSI